VSRGEAKILPILFGADAAELLPPFGPLALARRLAMADVDPFIALLAQLSEATSAGLGTARPDNRGQHIGIQRTCQGDSWRLAGPASLTLYIGVPVALNEGRVGAARRANFGADARELSPIAWADLLAVMAGALAEAGTFYLP
jgi:hypothetical protein